MKLHWLAQFIDLQAVELEVSHNFILLNDMSHSKEYFSYLY